MIGPMIGPIQTYHRPITGFMSCYDRPYDRVYPNLSFACHRDADENIGPMIGPVIGVSPSYEK